MNLGKFRSFTSHSFPWLIFTFNTVCIQSIAAPNSTRYKEDIRDIGDPRYIVGTVDCVIFLCLKNQCCPLGDSECTNLFFKRIKVKNPLFIMSWLLQCFMSGSFIFDLSSQVSTLNSETLNARQLFLWHCYIPDMNLKIWMQWIKWQQKKVTCPSV